jgi:hypothetical protein
MPALDTFGIQSISTALTRQFRLRKTVQTGDVVLTSVGAFNHLCAYNEEYMFDGEGSGDLPADFALAGAGPTISGLSGGITVIDSTGERQRTGQPNDWTASGEHAPDAALDD